MTTAQRIVLVIGSGLNAAETVSWPRQPFTDIVAINNAWRLRPDWTHAIHPEDFPADRRPQAGAGQTIITADDYVPVQNAQGGFIYAGGTMAFTAGYWALAALRPSVMAFIGCDMIYPAKGRTHFYGIGAADPLRDDVTLQSLEAKSARLMLLAARQGCAVVNLSSDRSRLVFPRARRDTLASCRPVDLAAKRVADAEARERQLGYFVPSGRYWLEPNRFDAAALAMLDQLWLSAHRASVGDLPVEARAAS